MLSTIDPVLSHKPKYRFIFVIWPLVFHQRTECVFCSIWCLSFFCHSMWNKNKTIFNSEAHWMNDYPQLSGAVLSLIINHSFGLTFLNAKATLEYQMSLSLSQKPFSLSELLLLTIEPINCQAYQPSSLSTIEPIDHWACDHQAYWPSSLSNFEPINHWAHWPSSLSTLVFLLRLLSLLACFQG